MTKVLYVEDNDDNVYMMKMQFELLDGFEFMTAEDGEAGYVKARVELPDLIPMDLDLPIVDGWELTRRLKRDSTTRHIPVIALTAHAMGGFSRAGACRRLRRVRYKADQFRKAHEKGRPSPWKRPRRRIRTVARQSACKPVLAPGFPHLCNSGVLLPRASAIPSLTRTAPPSV